MKLFFGSGKLPTVIGREEDIIISHQECDITNREKVAEYVRLYKPSVVVNAAANTNLENCEDNKHSSFLVNTYGPLNILMACEEIGAKFIHVSSGCLFDGNETISYEDTPPRTSAWYTHTKKWADDLIERYGYDNYLILRPRQMVSALAHPTNMLTKFSQYQEIYAHDQLNSITCVEDFGDMIDHLVKQDERGIFNCCNDGEVTPHEIAIGVKKYIKPSLQVYKADYEFTLTLQRNKRVNTILSNDKLKKTGYIPRNSHEALKWCLENYK